MPVSAASSERSCVSAPRAASSARASPEAAVVTIDAWRRTSRSSTAPVYRSMFRWSLGVHETSPLSGRGRRYGHSSSFARSRTSTMRSFEW